MTQSISTRLKLVLAAVALGAALVGGTASAAKPTAPNATACAHSKAAAKVGGKQAKAKAKTKASANSAVKCTVAPAP
jgi:hypothetical protein